MRRVLLSLALVPLCAAVLAGGQASATDSARTSATKAATVVITTRKVGKLGTVLVNSKGLTLYMFIPDKRHRVTCVQTCAVIWPPVKLAAGAKAVAKGAAKQKLLGSDRDPSGGRVVTYHGWPLYTYIADKRPGVAAGQALNLNGGLWYALSPSGTVIKARAAT